MTDYATCEIYLVVDEDGDYEVGPDQDAAQEAFESNIGGNGPRRIVKIVAKITTPQIEAFDLDIPDEAGKTTKIEASAA